MISENSPEWYSSIDEKPFSDRFEYDDTEAKRNQIQSFEKDINQMESMITSMEAMSKNIRAHLFEMQPASSEGLTTRLKPYERAGSHSPGVTSPDFNDADHTYSEVSCMSSSEDANYNDFNVLQTEPWKEVKRRTLPPPHVESTVHSDPNKETYQEELSADTTLLAVSDDGLQQTHHQEEMVTHSTDNLPASLLHRQTIKLEDLVSQAAKLLEDGATKPNIDTDALVDSIMSEIKHSFNENMEKTVGGIGVYETTDENRQEADENVKDGVRVVNARQQDAGKKTAKKNIDGTKRQQNASREKSFLFVNRNKEEEEDDDDDDDDEVEEGEKEEGDEEVEGQYGDQGSAGVRRGRHASWHILKQDRKECVMEPCDWSVQRQQGPLWPSEKSYLYDKKKRKKDVSENGNEQNGFRSGRQQGPQRAIKREQRNIISRGAKQHGDARKKSQQNDEHPNMVWQHDSSNMDATDQIFNTFSFQSYDDTLPADWGYSDDPDEEILFAKRDQLYNDVYSPDSFVDKRISSGKERNNEKVFVRGGSNGVRKQNSEMNLRRHIKSSSTNDISKIYVGSNSCQFPGMSLKGGHTLNSQVFSDSDEYQDTDWIREKDRRRTLSLTRHTPKSKSRGVRFNDTVYMIDDMYDKLPLRHQKNHHHCHHHNDHRHVEPYESIYSSSYSNPSHIRSCSKGFYNNPEHFYVHNYEAAEPPYDYSPWIKRPPQPAKHWSFVPFNMTPVSKVGQPQNTHASKKVGNPILKKTPQKGAESSNSGSKVVDRSHSLPRKTSESGLTLQSGYSPDSGYLSDTPKMLGCTNKAPPPNSINVKNISEARKDISNNSPKLKMVCWVMSMPVKDSSKNAVINKDTIYISTDFQNSDLHYNELLGQEKLGVPVKANEGKKIGCLVRELLQQVSACEVMNSKQATHKSNAAASSDAGSASGPSVLYCYLPSDVCPVSNKGECSTNGIRQNKNTSKNIEKLSVSTKPPCGKTTQTEKQDLSCCNKNIQRHGGLSWWVNGQDFHYNNPSKMEKIYRNVLPPPTAVSKSKPACFNNNNKQDNSWLDLNPVLKATRKGKASSFPTKKNVPAPQQPKRKPFLL